MIVQRTKTYAVCPACGADAGCVDHLLGQSLDTSWYCDSCGERYGLKFSTDGTVEITKVPGRKVTTIDVLVLKPQLKPVYFIVEGMRLEYEATVGDKLRRGVQKIKGEPIDDKITTPTTADELDHKQFFYESHSCPTNWLDPAMVYYDGDSDPHGLIEFVTTRDENTFPPDEMAGPNARDFAFVELIESNLARAEQEKPGARERLRWTSFP